MAKKEDVLSTIFNTQPAVTKPAPAKPTRKTKPAPAKAEKQAELKSDDDILAAARRPPKTETKVYLDAKVLETSTSMAKDGGATLSQVVNELLRRWTTGEL